MTGYRKAHHQSFCGYVREGEDFPSLVAAALKFTDSGEAPFWQSESHRKTYFEPKKKYFFKIVEEKGGLTCRKYFRHYRILKKHRIPTAEVVACFKGRPAGKKMSVIVTRELSGCSQFDHFLRSTAAEVDKLAAVEELARLALALHRAGYYFSMDLRNLFAGLDGKGRPEIHLLDLEHIKWAGLFFKRRINRNLSRFKKNIQLTAGGRTVYWDKFHETYYARS